MAAADLILDAYLENRVQLIGFENGAVRRVIELLRRRERELLGEIATAYEDVLRSGGGVGGAVPWSGRGLRFRRRALARVKDALAAFDADALSVIGDSLTDVALDEAGMFAETISEIVGPDVVDTMGLSRVDLRQLSVMVQDKVNPDLPRSVLTSYEEVRAAGRQAIASVDAAMTRAITDGASLDSITAQVRQIIGADRGSGLSHAAARFVRTRVMETANDAAGMTYRENADIVRAEQYVATLDDDTCEICGPLDGQQFPIVDGQSTIPRPPRHPHCRCFVIPVLASWQQMGLPDTIPDQVKRTLNGRAAERTVWRDWVRKDPQRLERVLGPGRARLVRQGAKLDDLATRTRVRTIAEVRERRARRRASRRATA